MLPEYEFTVRGQLKIYNRIVRNSFLLSNDLRVTLLFVLDRTIGWRKPWENISLKEFESGTFRRIAGRRNLVTPGTGLQPEQITSAIEALRDEQAIETVFIKSMTWYRVSEDWCHPDLQSKGRRSIWGLSESDYIYDGEV